MESVDSSAVADRNHLRGGSRSCWSGELDAAGGAGEEGVDGSQLGQQLLAITDPLRVELKDDVAVGDVFPVADIADPVVRQVRTDQDEVAGREAANVVSDDGPAGPVLDQVDLELGMVVPAAVRAGVVMGVPADVPGIVGTSSRAAGFPTSPWAWTDFRVRTILISYQGCAEPGWPDFARKYQ